MLNHSCTSITWVHRHSRIRIPKASQISSSVANGSPPLQNRRRYNSSSVALALWCGDGNRKLVTRFGVIQWVALV